MRHIYIHTHPVLLIKNTVHTQQTNDIFYQSVFEKTKSRARWLLRINALAEIIYLASDFRIGDQHISRAGYVASTLIIANSGQLSLLAWFIMMYKLLHKRHQIDIGFMFLYKM